MCSKIAFSMREMDLAPAEQFRVGPFRRFSAFLGIGYEGPSSGEGGEEHRHGT